MKCRICGNLEGNKGYEVKEMMYGYRDIHRYFQCSQCNCLQINEIPTDLQKYYGASYYSYRPIRQKPKIKHFLTHQRNKYALYERGLIGRVLYTIHPINVFEFLRPLLMDIDIESRILDVGCGAGELLQSFREAGFNHLLGIDPFIDSDIQYDDGLVIRKQSIHQVEDEFDLIMFHHSFEHVPDPKETLQSTIDLLAPGGYCVIRIPTVSSYAWKHYGENWVQLDAPRHFYLHSIESMEVLTRDAGLKLCNIIYDSTKFQFWGSEQYAKDIPLMDDRSYSKNPQSSIFQKEDVSLFEQRAHELNSQNQGDQAIFYLQKPNELSVSGDRKEQALSRF